MPSAIIDQLREQRETLVTEIEALMSADEFDPLDSTFVEARSKADSLDSKIRAIVEFDKARNSANEIDALSVRSAASTRETREAPTATGTMGELIVRSKLIEQYNFQGNSARATIPFDLQTRAPLTEGASPGSAFLPTPPKYVTPNGLESSPFLDSVGRLTISTNSIDIVTYGPIDGADVVPEGQPKPEGSFTASSTPVTLETLAVWVQATRQLLEDAVGLRDYLDTELRRSILRKVEQLTGAAVDGGTYTGVTQPTLLEGLRVAAGVVEMQGFSASTALVNPADLAQLDIAIWTGGGIGVPSGNTGAWGLRTIPVASIPAGTAYVGDFQTGVKLLSRSGVQVFVSDSHASTFVSNIFTILSEGRYKAVVTQPLAIVEVTVGTGLPLAAGAKK